MQRVVIRGCGIALVLALAATACDASEPQAGDGEGPSIPTSTRTGPSEQTPAANADLPPLEHLPGKTVIVGGGAPAALLWAYGSIWVQSHRGYDLRRIDPTTGQVSATIDTGVLGCGDLVAGAGSVWVTGCGITLGLVRVDPRANKVQTTSDLTGLGPGFSAGEIWIGSVGNAGEDLRHADPDHLGLAKAIPVTGAKASCGVVAAGDSVWLSDPSSAVVYRVNPRSEKVLAAIPMPLTPGDGCLINHDGSPWYIDPVLGALVRIDPKTDALTKSGLHLEKPDQYWGIAASTAPGKPGRLWVRSGDQAWLVDTRADRVVRRIAIMYGGGGDVQEVDGTLWVAGFAIDLLQKIPLTHRTALTRR